MSGLPKVSITLGNGALGTIAPGTDSICGLVVTGTTVGDGITAGEPVVINSLKDATDTYLISADNNAHAYKQIKEFYDLAGPTCELWLMLVANTMYLEDMADKTNPNGAVKLLNAAQGRIKLLGLSRLPDGGYEPSLGDGLDADSFAGIVVADQLAKDQAAQNKPIRVMVDCAYFLLSNLGDLIDLRTFTNNRVMGVIAATDNGGRASVGMVLGKAAGVPVQRNIGRVKDGALPYAERTMYIGNTLVEDVGANADTIHDKGYVIPRKFVGVSGYFLNDDPMAVAVTDDYSSLAHGRVIDKAQRIAYRTYLNELNDEVEINTDGTMVAGTVKHLQSIITQQIGTAMTGEISSVSAFIDPAQNVISTNKLAVKLRIVPVGYFKEIDVDLAFSNPAL